MARHALGIAAWLLLWVGTSGSAAGQARADAAPEGGEAAPSEQELEASEQVFDAAAEQEPAPAAQKTESPTHENEHEKTERNRSERDRSERDKASKLEISWSTLLTASGGEPETNLTLDDSGFRVEDHGRSSAPSSARRCVLD